MSFRVLEVARAVVDDVNVFLDNNRQALHKKQLGESVESIVANIREAQGRNIGPDRNQFFRFARASAEETDEHIRTNFGARRVNEKWYWQQHHRLTVIIRMLNKLMS
jgi:four helix bundle protein